MNNFCDGESLLTTLDRARPGDDCELAVANRRVACANHGFIRSKIERNQFVRLCDADHFCNTCQVFETPAIDWTFIACDTDCGPSRSRHGMGAKTDCLN